MAGGVAGGFVFVVFGFAGPASVVGYRVVFDPEGVLGIIMFVCVGVYIECMEGSQEGIVAAGGGATTGVGI